MSKNALNRRSVVNEILTNDRDLLVISGLGSSSYDVHASGDSDTYFYLWGAMGGAAMMGLGLALAQPDRDVVVITGDGEQLMGLGSIATIGVLKPKNLSIVVLDNGHFGETGMQVSHTGLGVNLAEIAKATGFEKVTEIKTGDEVSDISLQVKERNGPFFALVKIASESPGRSLPILDGVELKNRFRKALGHATL
ncbi:MAG: thiamine pyrophosphate-dependent enzyme [Proteobacteria bacterium]|jgi:thiamine pyrophosphate-dependent acetolactate synthase large subunit-like protein|nr:thiamine pyrophosphate-dependent enzyme [Pseudomonadota bacterium]